MSDQPDPADVVLAFELDEQIRQRIREIMFSSQTNLEGLIGPMLKEFIDNRIRSYLNHHLEQAHKAIYTQMPARYDATVYIP